MSSFPTSFLQVKLEEGVDPNYNPKTKICFQCGLPEPPKGRTPKAIAKWELCGCTSWDCTQCTTRLTSRASFRGHVTTQHPEYRTQMAIKTEESATSGGGSGSSGHRCPECNKLFGSPAFVAAHQKVAHAQKTQMCQFCHRTDFDTVMGLYNHMLKGCPEKEKHYERKVGSGRPINQQQARRKKVKKEPATEVLIKEASTPTCPGCDLGLDVAQATGHDVSACVEKRAVKTEKEALEPVPAPQRPAKRPRKTPLVPKALPSQRCKHCQQEFMTPKELYTHLLDGCEVRKEASRLKKGKPVLSRPTKLNQKASTCKYCKKEFESLSKYYYHWLKGCKAKEEQALTEQQISSCDVLPESVPSASTSSVLTMPVQQQSISIPVALGEAFIQDELITADMLCTVHLRLTKFTATAVDCPFCPAKFHFKESLESHLKRQHTKVASRCDVSSLEGVADSTDLAFETFQSGESRTKCPSCDLFFVQLSLLIEHFDRESEQGLICEECKDSKKNIGSHPHQEALERHRESKHILMGFETKQCKWCEEGFQTGLKCDRHIVSCHADKVPLKDATEETGAGVQIKQEVDDLPVGICIKVEPVSDEEEDHHF